MHARVQHPCNCQCLDSWHVSQLHILGCIQSAAYRASLSRPLASSIGDTSQPGIALQ